MTVQHGVNVRSAEAAAILSQIGASPLVRIFDGSIPANCAAADAGTVVSEINCPATWATESAGVLTLAGTWQDASANATGLARYFRMYNTAGSVCHEQGLAGAAVNLSTNGTTASGNAVLNFATTTGVLVGMRASGTGVAAGSIVVAVTGTTVTLDRVTTGVASAAAITFLPDLVIDNPSIVAGQVVNVTAWQRTIGNA